MRRILFIAGLVAAAAAWWAPSSYADTNVATMDGRIISSTDAATLGLQTAPVPDPVVIDGYSFTDELVDPLADPVAPPGNMKTTFWGYEASAGSAVLHSYTGYPSGPVVAGASCVPTLSGGAGLTANGRGVAFDPLTADLWISRVDQLFNGDGKLYLVVPPNADATCPEVREIVVHAKPGQPIQDDFGALDVDEATKHIWAAGYKPIVSGGLEKSYIYLINRNTGLVLQSCWLPFRGGGIGNDTLASYRNPTLPGSSKYLLTDAGELDTAPDSYALIDQSDCHNGRQVAPIAEFAKTTPGGVSGIDVEWGGMVSTNSSTFFNNGDQPFGAAAAMGVAFQTQAGVEDISVCGFRAAFGGTAGNDFCPYP